MKVVLKNQTNEKFRKFEGLTFNVYSLCEMGAVIEVGVTHALCPFKDMYIVDLEKEVRELIEDKNTIKLQYIKKYCEVNNIDFGNTIELPF